MLWSQTPHSGLWPSTLLKIPTMAPTLLCLSPQPWGSSFSLGGIWQMTDDGRISWNPRTSFHARSFGKFADRLRLFSRPQISIHARGVAFNTFVQSVMLYAISYFGITSRDLNYLRQGHRSCLGCYNLHSGLLNSGRTAGMSVRRLLPVFSLICGSTMYLWSSCGLRSLGAGVTPAVRCVRSRWLFVKVCNKLRTLSS